MTPAELDGLPVTFGLATAARALGIGRNQAYALATAGQFPIRLRVVCGRYRVSKFDLMAWLGAPGYPSADNGADGESAGSSLRPVRGGDAA